MYTTIASNHHFIGFTSFCESNVYVVVCHSIHISLLILCMFYISWKSWKSFYIILFNELWIDWTIRPHTFTILHCSHLHITVLEKKPIINQFVVNKWILNNWNDTNQFSRNRKIPWTQNMNLERFNGINVIWREEADVEKERIRR